MSSQIPALDLLVHELTRLPGIGEKTAQRLAYYILRAGPSYSQKLKEALDEVEEKVHLCPQCFAYTDQETLCKICQGSHRQQNVLCVVEEPSDIFRIDAAGVFLGSFHVLHGTISPLNGIHPENLRIKELVERIDRGLQGTGPKVEEVILALDADLEGDTTVLYLSKILVPKGVKVTRIAHGVPFGSDIDYIDRRTLGRAIENRVEL